MNEEFIKARRCNSIRILGRTFICSSLWCWEWQSSWGGNSSRWNLSTSDYAGEYTFSQRSNFLHVHKCSIASVLSFARFRNFLLPIDVPITFYFK